MASTQLSAAGAGLPHNLLFTFPSSSSDPLARLVGGARATSRSPRDTPAALAEEARRVVGELNNLVRSRQRDAHARAASALSDSMTSTLTVGALVWLISTSRKTGLRPDKLTALKDGPFRVVRRLSDFTSLVVHLLTGRHKRVANSRVLPINSSRLDVLNDVVRPNLLNHEYLVQAVLDRRTSRTLASRGDPCRRPTELLIQWRYWGNLATWEQLADVDKVLAVRQYLAAHTDLGYVAPTAAELAAGDGANVVRPRGDLADAALPDADPDLAEAEVEQLNARGGAGGPPP